MNVTWYVLGAVSGFVGGLVAAFMGWPLLQFLLPGGDDTTAAARQAALDERDRAIELMLDDTPCPQVGADALLGTWTGEHAREDGAGTYRWAVTHRADGRFEGRFFEGDAPAEHTKGYWGYSGCVYTMVVEQGSPPYERRLRRDVYRVHALNADTFRYSLYPDGIVFESHRGKPP